MSFEMSFQKGIRPTMQTTSRAARTTALALATLAALGLAAAAVPAQAQTRLTTAAAVAGNDSVDWSQIGPDTTRPSSTFTAATANGDSVQVSQPSGSFERLTEGPSWRGNFTPNMPVLWDNQYGPSMTFTFDKGMSAAGLQISADTYGAFTAQVQAYGQSNALLGTFTEAGTMNGNNNGSAIYLGVGDSSTPIYKLVYSLTSAYLSPNDFAVGQLDLHDAATTAPEPSSVAAFAFTGLGALGLMLKARRRNAAA
jgi:hypothetical protein